MKMLTVTKIVQKNEFTGTLLLKLRFTWRKVEENSDCKYTDLPSDDEQAKTPNITQAEVSSTDVSDSELEPYSLARLDLVGRFVGH